MPKLSLQLLCLSLSLILPLPVTAEVEEMVETHQIQETFQFSSGTVTTASFQLPTFDSSLGNLERVVFTFTETLSVLGGGQPFTDPVFDGPNGYIAADFIYWEFDLSQFGGGIVLNGNQVGWFHHYICDNPTGCSFDSTIIDFPDWYISDPFGQEIPGPDYPVGDEEDTRPVFLIFQSTKDEFAGTIEAVTTIELAVKLEYFYTPTLESAIKNSVKAFVDNENGTASARFNPNPALNLTLQDVVEIAKAEGFNIHHFNWYQEVTSITAPSNFEWLTKAEALLPDTESLVLELLFLTVISYLDERGTGPDPAIGGNQFTNLRCLKIATSDLFRGYWDEVEPMSNGPIRLSS